jgi:gluconate kinase
MDRGRERKGIGRKWVEGERINEKENREKMEKGRVKNRKRGTRRKWIKVERGQGKQRKGERKRRK